MAKISNFNRLAENFAAQNADFKIFEIAFLTRQKDGTKKSIEKDIDQFQKWLSIFTDLYTDISKEALIEDTAGHRSQYVNWLTVIINRIQFIYLTQLSYKLSYLYNKQNLFIARLSIAIGVLIAIVSLAFPYFTPNQLEDDVKTLRLSSQSQQTKIIELEGRLIHSQVNFEKKQDSLIALVKPSYSKSRKLKSSIK